MIKEHNRLEDKDLHPPVKDLKGINKLCIDCLNKCKQSDKVEIVCPVRVTKRI